MVKYNNLVVTGCNSFGKVEEIMELIDIFETRKNYVES